MDADMVQIRANKGLPEKLTKYEIEAMNWLLRGMKGNVSEKANGMIGDLLQCGYVAAYQPLGNGWRGYAVTDAGRAALDQS